jgi:hypothetical protein
MSYSSPVGHSLLDITEKSGLPLSSLSDAASALLQHHLLEVKPQPDRRQ